VELLLAVATAVVGCCYSSCWLLLQLLFAVAGAASAGWLWLAAAVALTTAADAGTGTVRINTY
jgi:hypothetical protein